MSQPSASESASAASAGSGVACIAMLRKEEPVEEPVDLEEALAADEDFVAGEAEISLRGEFAKVIREMLGGVFAVFLAKIVAVRMSEFELEDEFAEEALLVVRRIGPVNGQAPGIDFGHVGTDVGLVLVVDSAEMAKARDSGREQVGSGPEAVAVDEFRRLGILHHGV